MPRGLHKIAKHITIMKPSVVLVLGPPGAGKGTQCQNIVEEFRYLHLSAGHLLREEAKKPNTEYGKLIETCMKDGKIVPVEITCNLLLNAMKQCEKDKFLIDGFPRNLDNLDGWNKVMSKNVDCKFMIFLDCPQNICIERVLSRGASGSGRTDDNLETLNKRFQLYEEDTRPIIDYFSKQGLMKYIDASKSPPEVFHEIKKLFQNPTPTKIEVNTKKIPL